MKTDFKIQNEEEPNKYEQYLKRKQNPVSISPLPSPSARIANRLSELQQKHHPKSQHQQISTIQLKSKIQQLERQLSSQRNTIIIKQQKIKQLNQELLNQPRRYKDQIQILKLTLQKKQANYNNLQEKYSSLESKSNELQKIIETYTKQLKQFKI